MYHSDLEKDIKNEEQGALGRIFRSLASGERPGGENTDLVLAREEAQQLYDVRYFIKLLFSVHFQFIITFRQEKEHLVKAKLKLNFKFVKFTIVKTL